MRRKIVLSARSLQHALLPSLVDIFSVLIAFEREAAVCVWVKIFFLPPAPFAWNHFSKSLPTSTSLKSKFSNCFPLARVQTVRAKRRSATRSVAVVLVAATVLMLLNRRPVPLFMWPFQLFHFRLYSLFSHPKN